MSNAESVVMSALQIAPSWRHALKWIGASAIAVPVAVLLHELGHLLAYVIFGFQGTELHYSSSTYSLEKTFWQQVYRGNLPAAASMIPLWKVGLATAAGIFITCAVTFVCWFFVAKKSPHPLVVALGIFSPVRFLSGIPTLLVWLSGKPVRAGTDEAHLAALTGIPVVLLIIAGVLFLLLAWVWLVRRIPKRQRRISLGGLVLGLAAGGILYFRLAGPWLLP